MGWRESSTASPDFRMRFTTLSNTLDFRLKICSRERERDGWGGERETRIIPEYDKTSHRSLKLSQFMLTEEYNFRHPRQKKKVMRFVNDEYKKWTISIARGRERDTHTHTQRKIRKFR